MYIMFTAFFMSLCVSLDMSVPLLNALHVAIPKDNLNDNIAWLQRRYSHYSDYFQDMDIPHFGQELSGERYYYFFLILVILGLVIKI